MVKILVADDDKLIANFIVKVLKSFDVYVAEDGEKAWLLFQRIQPELVLLDIMMPKMDGFELCQKIREQNPRVPILILTAKLQTEDKVTGLRLGADDYITKPFNRHELLARIETALRRVALMSPIDPVGPTAPAPLDVDGLVVQVTTRQVFFQQQEIKLSKTEFNLIQLMCERANHILDRDTLFREVWGYDFAGNTRTVDNFVMRLRKKLNELVTSHNKEYPFIETMYGVGYRLRSSSGNELQTQGKWAVQDLNL